MLRLQNGEVIYNNSENLGAVESLHNTGEGFSVSLPDGSMVFIPEKDCTAAEAEVFTAYHEFYRDTGGLPPPVIDEPGPRIATLKERLEAAEEVLDMYLMGQL